MKCRHPLCGRFYHEKCLDEFGGFWDLRVERAVGAAAESAAASPVSQRRTGKRRRKQSSENPKTSDQPPVRYFICPSHFCSRCFTTASPVSLQLWLFVFLLFSFYLFLCVFICIFYKFLSIALFSVCIIAKLATSSSSSYY